MRPERSKKSALHQAERLPKGTLVSVAGPSVRPNVRAAKMSQTREWLSQECLTLPLFHQSTGKKMRVKGIAVPQHPAEVVLVSRSRS